VKKAARAGLAFYFSTLQKSGAHPSWAGLAFHLLWPTPKLLQHCGKKCGAWLSHCTRAQPQQHFVERAATASLRDQVTRQHKCKLLCLVVLEKGCQFLTVYSGRAVKIPLNCDHGKN
jgi:hypothetical protein